MTPETFALAVGLLAGIAIGSIVTGFCLLAVADLMQRPGKY